VDNMSENHICGHISTRGQHHGYEKVCHFLKINKRANSLHGASKG